jgi:[ribosomal protein S18]-alanine N-acetyltransferase
LAFEPEQKPAPLPVLIRDMTLSDVPEVFAIEVSAYPLPWPIQCFIDELTKNNFARYYVAVTGGQVVGYAGQWAIADEGHITTIAVDYGFRRRRVAEQLLVSQIEYSLERRASAIFLEVRRYNIPAQRLYARYRFIPVRVREHYYQDNLEDAVEMRAECIADERFIPNYLRHRRELHEALGL